MKKVITYGTFDLLHYGHIRLLERAKALGDYLIVAVTADDFDKRRGKINVQQSLMQRIESVKKTGLADEIIVEEYEGQKIDDIINYGIDIFVIGSDWLGKFDYLKEYCEVVYLERTKGVSSTQIRSENSNLKMGIVGDNPIIIKTINESKHSNGISIVSVCTQNEIIIDYAKENKIQLFNDYDSFLKTVDSVYVVSSLKDHYNHVKNALKKNKHVLCESPICFNKKECAELFELAKQKNLILMEAIKTAYSTAFNRLVLLVKSGAIGKIVSIDSTCTSLKEYEENTDIAMLTKQNSIVAWGPTALLPIFKILGVNYSKKHFSSYYLDEEKSFDLFTKIDFNYDSAVASIKVGKGVKSEGELIISGTKGYVYVPSPWWKTDYFELRFENPLNNKRYFYNLDGEGIRYELVSFVKSVQSLKSNQFISLKISEAITTVIEDFTKKINLDEIIEKSGD